MKKNKQREEEPFSAESYIAHLSSDQRIARMKNYIQHGSVSTYEHVRSVAKTSVVLNQRLHLHADERRLIKGAFLHDYYLYDWHDSENESGRMHGFKHPKIAMDKADRDFHLTDLERNMIRSHMWPLTLFHMPKSREAWLLCVADKIVSTHETLLKR